jgi:pyridoxamine 5'-phosphate oxidase family protein
MNTELTDEELAYLRVQPLGRLATVDRDHAPQVVPVGFFVDSGTGQISIGGRAMGSSRKFRRELIRITPERVRSRGLKR